MKIWHLENVVDVVHPLEPTVIEHGSLVVGTKRLLEGILKKHPKAAVYHELTATKSADSAYLQAWADVGKQFKEKVRSM